MADFQVTTPRSFSPQSQSENPCFVVLPAQHRGGNAQHFYIRSTSGRDYVASYIRTARRREWHCTCPDYTFRRLAQRRHCKHLRQLIEMVRLAGGLRKLLALAQPGGAA